MKSYLFSVISRTCLTTLVLLLYVIPSTHVTVCIYVCMYGDIQRQARGLISRLCLGVKSRLLSFNRIKSRAVTGLLTGHNTLRRHFHLLELSDSPLCRRCGAEDETSAHILCDCEALASHRHAYLGFFFLEPENIKSLILGAIWNSSKKTGLP
jgi:hypothetical protein